jgi:hypothetical protein
VESAPTLRVIVVAEETVRGSLAAVRRSILDGVVGIGTVAVGDASGDTGLVDVMLATQRERSSQLR